MTSETHTASAINMAICTHFDVWDSSMQGLAQDGCKPSISVRLGFLVSQDAIYYVCHRRDYAYLPHQDDVTVWLINWECYIMSCSPIDYAMSRL